MMNKLDNNNSCEVIPKYNDLNTSNLVPNQYQNMIVPERQCIHSSTKL